MLQEWITMGKKETDNRGGLWLLSARRLKPAALLELTRAVRAVGFSPRARIRKNRKRPRK